MPNFHTVIVCVCRIEFFFGWQRRIIVWCRYQSMDLLIYAKLSRSGKILFANGGCPVKERIELNPSRRWRGGGDSYLTELNRCGF